MVCVYGTTILTGSIARHLRPRGIRGWRRARRFLCWYARTPKAAKDIWAILNKAGVSRYAEIVCFSDDPGEAAANYYILKLMGFPDDLPNLARLKPPAGNSRPEGIEHSYFVQIKKAILPEVY